MTAEWDASIKRFEESLDGVASVSNIAKAAIAVFYQAHVLSSDDAEIVLMLDKALWDEVDNQIEMFMTYMAMEQELDQLQPPTEGAQ